MLQTPLQENIIVVIAGTLLLILLGSFIISFLFFYKRKQHTNRLEKVEMQSKFQQELLRTQLEIQEQTLKTISQEIHDNIGQVLSLAKLNLSTMETERTDELKVKISDSKQLVSKAIQDLRDLSKTMNTDNIEAIGFIRAVEYEMDMLRKAGIAATLNIGGNTSRLEPQKELILFRIVQEVLNNIIKHAEATAIIIDIDYNEKDIKVVLNDNGRGFDLTPLNENNNNFGLGIRNMHSRAKLIGADFSISSSTGEGTTVSLTAPLINHNL